MVVEEIPILKDIIANNQELIDDMTDKLNAIETELEHYEDPKYHYLAHWLAVEIRNILRGSKPKGINDE